MVAVELAMTMAEAVAEAMDGAMEEAKLVTATGWKRHVERLTDRPSCR